MADARDESQTSSENMGEPTGNPGAGLTGGREGVVDGSLRGDTDAAAAAVGTDDGDPDRSGRLDDPDLGDPQAVDDVGDLAEPMAGSDPDTAGGELG
jgi:hypothetical protein